MRETAEWGRKERRIEARNDLDAICFSASSLPSLLFFRPFSNGTTFFPPTRISSKSPSRKSLKLRRSSSDPSRRGEAVDAAAVSYARISHGEIFIVGGREKNPWTDTVESAGRGCAWIGWAWM